MFTELDMSGSPEDLCLVTPFNARDARQQVRASFVMKGSGAEATVVIDGVTYERAR